MEVKILDSIIHGDLKPWTIDTTDQRRFTGLLKAANAALPNTNTVLLSQLNALLADYPDLLKKLKKDTPRNNNDLVNHFYKIDLPKFKDPVTQFYQKVISIEALRFFNAYLQQAANWIDPIDIYHQVNNTLTSIRVLASQTNEELQERGFASVPDVQSDFIHFTLYTLKQTLTALFFGVQERFKTQLTEITTEDFFYINYLNEAYPEVSPLTPDTAYFEFHFRSIQTAEEFPKSAALHLLKQIQQHQPDQHQRLQAAFENLIFLQSQNVDTSNQTIEQLTEPGTVKQFVDDTKATIFNAANQDNYGHERVAIFQAAIDDLDYILPTSLNKNSIPSLLMNWLTQNKEMYSQNANSVFSKNTNAEGEAARLKNPLSKKDKATIDQQKQYAKEHLDFMNGYNVKNEKIMPEADFNRMMEYTYFLIEKQKIPTGIKPISQTGFASIAIRYTYYKIHEFLYGTQSIKQEWIDFIHAIFSQFSNTSTSTTKAKFSQKPKSYDADLKVMKR